MPHRIQIRLSIVTLAIGFERIFVRFGHSTRLRLRLGLRHTGIQAYTHTGIQAYRHTGIQAHRHTGIHA